MSASPERSAPQAARDRPAHPGPPDRGRPPPGPRAARASCGSSWSPSWLRRCLGAHPHAPARRRPHRVAGAERRPGRRGPRRARLRLAATPLVSASTPAPPTRRLEALPWVDDGQVSRAWPRHRRGHGRPSAAPVARRRAAGVVLVDGAGRCSTAGRRPPPGLDLPRRAARRAELGERPPPAPRGGRRAGPRCPPSCAAQVACGPRRPGDGVDAHPRRRRRRSGWGDASRARPPRSTRLAALLDQADRATIDRIDVTVPRAVHDHPDRSAEP